MHAKNTKAVYLAESDNDNDKAAFTRIDKEENEETYRIEYYSKRNVLKVSKIGKQHNGGYMPLIFNIKNAKFETKKDKIIIHIDEYNKGKSDLVFQLDEKKKYDKTRKKSQKSKRERLT